MGVAHGPLRRRHSGKGRAVPERLPVDRSLRFCGCTCPCPARRGERIVQSWSPRYVLEPPWRTRSSCPASNLSVNPMWPGVQSAFVRRLDDFGAGNLPQATERAFLDCQLEDALYTTAVASAPGNTQAIALVRAAVEQLKAKLKAELLAAPPTMPPKE